ncbi:MAG: porin family protein [Gammaproteobacteria bacterium]|nr:porin family protein [Gammaproteobacteria bacterium]
MARTSLVILLLALSASASAEGFDYNYLTLGYGNIEFDNINVDGDGFGIGGSYAINDRVHVFAGYDTADLDFDVDATTLGLGIGYNTSLSDTVDMIARVSYESVEIDVPGFGSADDSGFGLGLGLRFAASEQLELNAGINYVDLGDSGDDTGFEAGGLYSFTDAFALGLSGSWGDNVSAYSVTGRFYFGQ